MFHKILTAGLLRAFYMFMHSVSFRRATVALLYTSLHFILCDLIPTELHLPTPLHYDPSKLNFIEKIPPHPILPFDFFLKDFIYFCKRD